MCKFTPFRADFRGFGPLLYIPLGSRYTEALSKGVTSIHCWVGSAIGHTLRRLKGEYLQIEYLQEVPLGSISFLATALSMAPVQQGT